MNNSQAWCISPKMWTFLSWHQALLQEWNSFYYLFELNHKAEIGVSVPFSVSIERKTNARPAQLVMRPIRIVIDPSSFTHIASPDRWNKCLKVQLDTIGCLLMEIIGRRDFDSLIHSIIPRTRCEKGHWHNFIRYLNKILTIFSLGTK